MLETFLQDPAVQKIVEMVIAYLFGKAGDALGDKYIDKVAMRRTVKHILKDDNSYIQESFSVLILSDSEVESISHFLIDNIFQNMDYLYPVSSLPAEKQNMIWSSFQESLVGIDKISIKEAEVETFRQRLIECVNHHNSLIGNSFLDEGERIIIKAIERNHSNLLGYIGQTLNSASGLQSEEAILDYSHKQLEGIIHARRMDLRHHRLVFLLAIIGLFVFSCLAIQTVPRILYSINWAELSNANYASIVLVFIFTLTSSAFFVVFLFESMKINQMERSINRCTETLWSLHFESYQGQMKQIIAQQDTLKKKYTQEGE